MIIYKITNLINNKLYIGKDSRNDPNYFGSGMLIKKAIKKYNKENFKKEILEECESLEELNYKEKYWINELRSLSPNGYNITIGGTGGDTFTNQTEVKKDEINKKRINTFYSKYGVNYFKRKLSEETKKKISDSSKGKKIINRKSPTKFTDEHKEKISKSNKGRKLTDEHKEKISNFKKGTKLSNETKIKISKNLRGNSNAKGYKHTDEAKKRMSEKKIGYNSNKGYKWTDEQKLRLKERRKNKNKK